MAARTPENNPVRRTVPTRPTVQNQNQPTKETLQNQPMDLPENDTNSPTTATGRRKPTTHKDLTILYMMKGIDAITPVLNESNDPIGALDKIIGTLSDNQQDTDELTKLRDFYADLRNVGQPGRAPVKIGMERLYSVQQQGDEGDLFVRIPVSPLDVQRGMKVRVRFEENRIVVEPES